VVAAMAATLNAAQITFVVIVSLLFLFVFLVYRFDQMLGRSVFAVNANNIDIVQWSGIYRNNCAD
jgi:ABC-type xylose transport system permease subunit